MSFTEVLAELAVNLRLDSSQFATGATRAAGSARKLEQGLGGVPRGVTAITTALGGLAGSFAGGILIGGVAELGNKLVELGTGAIEHAAALKVTSQQLGVTTDDLQRYRFAAGQVGLEQEKVDLGLKRLNKSVGLADRGLGPGAKAFAAMGISVRDASGHLKTVGAILPEVAGYIAKLPDPAARAALEFQLFGRSGQDMAPLLNKGAEGVKSLVAQADKAGAVISPQLIERAHELEVRFTKLKTVIETKTEAGLLTAIEKIGDAADGVGKKVQGADDWLAKLQASADEWDKKNNVPTKSQFLGQFATEPLQAFDKWLLDVQGHAADIDRQLGIPAPKAFIQSLTDEFKAENVQGIRNLGKLLSGVVDVIDQLPGAAARAWRGFSQNWDLITAKTAAMGASIRKSLGSDLDGAWTTLKQKVKEGGDAFHDLWNRVVGHSYVPDMVDAIAAQMQRLDAVMVAPISAATAKAGDKFRELAGKLAELERQLFPEAAAKNVLADNIKTINDGLKAGAIDETTWLASLDRLMGGSAVTLTTETIPALAEVKQNIDGIGGSIDESPMLPWLDKMMGALQGVGELVDQVFGHKAGGIFGAIVNAVGAIAPLFSGGFKGFKVTAPSASQPFGDINFAHRALGGPVVPGRMYEVGENGPEYVSFGSRGYVHPHKGGNDNRRPYFDLRGAVITTDLLQQMNRIGEVATGRGAIMGAAAAEQRGARRASQRIP
jgi:hypothetical protein